MKIKPPIRIEITKLSGRWADPSIFYTFWMYQGRQYKESSLSCCMTTYAETH